jgi:hypothetical protein
MKNSSGSVSCSKDYTLKEIAGMLGPMESVAMKITAQLKPG